MSTTVPDLQAMVDRVVAQASKGEQIEAYVSRKASLYSDAQALEAMRLLAPNLRAAFNEPGNRAARGAAVFRTESKGAADDNKGLGDEAALVNDNPAA